MDEELPQLENIKVTNVSSTDDVQQSTETSTNNSNQSTETVNNDSNQSTETVNNDNNQSTETVNNDSQFTSHVTTHHHSTQQPETTTVHQTTTATTTETSTTTTTTTETSTTTATTTETATTSLPVNITDDWLTDDDVTAEGIHPTSTWMQVAEDVQTSQTHSTVEESPPKFLVSLNRGLSNDLEPVPSMETMATNDDVVLISTPSGLTAGDGLPVDNPTLEHDTFTTAVQDVVAAFDKLEVVPLHGTSLINTSSTASTAATTTTAASTSVQTTAIVEDVAVMTMQATGSAGNATWHQDLYTATTTSTSLNTTTSTSLNTTTSTSLNTTTLSSPTPSSEMIRNQTEVQLISKAGTLGSATPVDTGASPVTYTPYKPTCETTDAAVSMWLGFPVFWWVVVAVAFVLILVMILSCCVCVMTSKRRWRKKNQQRRGYLDDQLTSSFIQAYSNPEVTPSSRNNKNGKIPPKPLKKIHKGKSSYPKSYHLGPQLLPFPADAVRLKPSSPSTPKSSENFKNLANGGSSTEDCLGSKDVAGLKVKVQSNRDPETTFGTWRKSGVAVYGGLVPGCKKSSASNPVDADASDKKTGKGINDDDVFEEATVEAPRDVGLTTFSYKNSTNGGTTSTFKS